MKKLYAVRSIMYPRTDRIGFFVNILEEEMFWLPIRMNNFGFWMKNELNTISHYDHVAQGSPLAGMVPANRGERKDRRDE